MNKTTIIRKLDEGVDALRGLLAENEGSTLKTIAASAKQGFNCLKAAFRENEQAQKAMAEIKSQLEDLEESIKKGDKKLSAKILAATEKKLNRYKEKYEKKDDGAEKNPAAASAGKRSARGVKAQAPAAKQASTAKAAKPKAAAAKDKAGAKAKPATPKAAKAKPAAAAKTAKAAPTAAAKTAKAKPATGAKAGKSSQGAKPKASATAGKSATKTASQPKNAPRNS